ncbi:MAG TPA: decarboxylating 6-phosphogluconate dehydrogenase [Gammaproteobacteria bacterium]|nr:decarboxylating 6-phosphogluconate dehydrogenase [Gammaproteobacteria bacterium]
MQLGMIGLGRMGAGMARRLMRQGHTCVVYDAHAEAARALRQEGAVAADSLSDLVRKLEPPRTVWIMLPAAAVGGTVAALEGLLAPGDIVVDGGNSHYREDMARAAFLKSKGIHYVDVGTSGGVWGLAEGFCLMIGGEDAVVRHLDPLFAALAPGLGTIPRTPGRQGQSGTAEQGYLHCGGAGAGHFVKMVHNGIEYGIMQAYAEGLNVLRHAGAGKATRSADAETAPLANPKDYRYEFDVGEIAEVWRRGSVIHSWLLDLAAHALHADPGLEAFRSEVSDSGEGRWTLQAAVDTSVPVPVLSAAVYARFASRGEDDFANRLLSALRAGFGGHAVDKK